MIRDALARTVCRVLPHLPIHPPTPEGTLTMTTDSTETTLTKEELLSLLRRTARDLDDWLDIIIAATHSEDIIIDGDGDWEVVEGRLSAVRHLVTREQLDGKRWGLDGPATILGKPIEATADASKGDA